MKRQHSTRREFLKGRSILGAIREGPCIQAEAVGDLGSPPRPPVGLEQQDRQNHYVEHYSINAMACEFEMSFNLQQHRLAGELALRAFTLIEELEDQLSIYRSDSEISRINQLGFNHPQTLESGLRDLLALALEIYRQTDGAFDITSRPLSRLWGFDARKGRLPSEEEIEQTMSCIGSRFLRLDLESSQFSFEHPETQLDLGGIGKGYALDRVAELMETSAAGNWVLHGGQSSVIARGDCLQSDGPSDGWPVGLTHPLLAGQRIAEVVLRDQALGTSGTARQGFFHDGVRYGHIIDPRSGWPTHHCLSTTVICEKAARADALATAFFVMSPQQVEAYCRAHPDVGAILVLPGKTTAHTELLWFNLNDGDWRRG